MRKRNLKFVFDKILWLALYLLPFLIVLYNTRVNGLLDYSMFDVFQSGVGFDMTHGLIVDMINTMFGVDGYIPLIEGTNCLPYYIQWLCTIGLVQVVYDVIMFIPKLAHKYMHIMTQDEE